VSPVCLLYHVQLLMLGKHGRREGARIVCNACQQSKPKLVCTSHTPPCVCRFDGTAVKQAVTWGEYVEQVMSTLSPEQVRARKCRRCWHKCVLLSAWRALRDTQAALPSARPTSHPRQQATMLEQALAATFPGTGAAGTGPDGGTANGATATAAPCAMQPRVSLATLRGARRAALRAMLASHHLPAHSRLHLLLQVIMEHYSALPACCSDSGGGAGGHSDGQSTRPRCAWRLSHA
jgi:hypothetical protein